MAGSLRRPDVDTFEPGVRDAPDTATSGGATVVTLDARDPDRWVRFDLDAAAVVSEREGWELAFRRYEVRAAPEAPAEVLEGWYRYDFFSHLLIPRDRSYRLSLEDGRLVEIRFLSYYCPGPEAGCVTFRYRTLPGAATSGP